MAGYWPVAPSSTLTTSPRKAIRLSCGTALAGVEILGRYPIAGAGLTGEPFVEREVTNLYVRSRFYSSGWQIVSPSTELLINYFWLHWIYLGFVWGVIMIAALTAWLRVLHVPSTAFCWTVWAILGQASGAYVGPICWAVLFLAAAAAVLHERSEGVGRNRGRTPMRVLADYLTTRTSGLPATPP